MTGPDHYAEAERLLALAGRHSKGATYGQEWTLTLAAAQIHATLAVAAATAVGTAGPDGRAWADVAATKPGASEPEAPDTRVPGSAPPPAGPHPSSRPSLPATTRSAGSLRHRVRHHDLQAAVAQALPRPPAALGFSTRSMPPPRWRSAPCSSCPTACGCVPSSPCGNPSPPQESGGKVRNPCALAASLGDRNNSVIFARTG